MSPLNKIFKAIAGIVVDEKTPAQKMWAKISKKKPNIKKIIALANAGATDSDGKSPLLLAAQLGKADVVKALIETGVDLNQKDNDGHTALTWAVAMKHTDVVKVLIEKGADIDAGKAAGGLNAVAVATQLRYQAGLDLLLSPKPA